MICKNLEAMMTFLRKATLKDDIRNKISERIFSNELKPGERIVETQLARELGVSQSPVREAIRELELMGIIESKPFLGSFVKKLTPKDIKYAFKIRAYLEMLAVSDTIENITEAQLEDMDDLLRKMRKTAEKQMKTEFVELDISFHRAIIRLSNNNFLEKIWDSVHLGQWTSITTNTTKKSLMELAERHEDILQSLKERNAEKASKCIQQHIEELCDEVYSNMSNAD